MTGQAESQLAQSETQLRFWVGIGGVTLLLLVVILGGWGAFANISSAVIASGRVVVESNPKLVQHRDGGIVGAIHVRDGDRVTAGSLLISLDGTATRANLAIVSKQLHQWEARAARLQAIIDGAEAIAFPQHLLAVSDDETLVQTVEGERRLFAAQRASLEGERAQLEQRADQYRLEAANYQQMQAAGANQLRLATEELGRLTTIYEKGVISLARMTQEKRMVSRLEGEMAEAAAKMADAAGRQSETELAILQLDKSSREQALAELREAESQIAELTERRRAAQDTLQRIDIRAPQNGVVHQLSMHTIGGVVAPGADIMTIVPVGDALVVTARVRPTDIDQVRVGQEASVRFPALNQRTTPETFGTVLRVGADLTIDDYDGSSFFKVRIALKEESRALLKDVELVPGMPAEVYIQTGERTALNYLVKPLTDQFTRAFREG